MTNPFIFALPRNQTQEQQSGPQAPATSLIEGCKTREYMPMSSEEDGNASRRKRRKTEKTKNTGHEASLRAGLSGWLGKEISAPGNTPEAAPSSEPSAPLAPFTHDKTLPTPAAIPKDEASPQDQQGPPIDATKPKRKIVKLNVSGKLLSSSPTSLQTPLRLLPQLSQQTKGARFSS